jgi:hypothetical protein
LSRQSSEGNDLLVAFFAVVVVILVITVITLIARRAGERRRSANLAGWAASNGWSFQDGDVDTPWRDRVRGLPQFTIRRTVSRTVDGFPVTVADGKYTVGRNDIRDVVILCVQLPGVGPETRVAARGAVSNMLRTVGLKTQPTITTGDVDFDRRFAINTDDPHWAAQLFSPELIDAISADDVWSWTFHGNEILVVKKEHFVLSETQKHATYVVGMARLLLEEDK